MSHIVKIGDYGVACATDKDYKTFTLLDVMSYLYYEYYKYFGNIDTSKVRYFVSRQHEIKLKEVPVFDGASISFLSFGISDDSRCLIYLGIGTGYSCDYIFNAVYGNKVAEPVLVNKVKLYRKSKWL